MVWYVVVAAVTVTDVSATGDSSLAFAAVRRTLIVEGSLKKSSSTGSWFEDRPVLIISRISCLYMVVSCGEWGVWVRVIVAKLGYIR
jgi:hypothetical protein